MSSKLKMDFYFQSINLLEECMYTIRSYFYDVHVPCTLFAINNYYAVGQSLPKCILIQGAKRSWVIVAISVLRKIKKKKNYLDNKPLCIWN